MNYRSLTFALEIGVYPLWTDEGHSLELEDMSRLGLSEPLIQRIRDLSAWYDCYLNPIYQGLPSLWQQGVCDAFNREAHAVFCAIAQELPQVNLIKRFVELKEDPELVEYLDRPVSYYKRRGIVGGLE